MVAFDFKPHSVQLADSFVKAAEKNALWIAGQVAELAGCSETATDDDSLLPADPPPSLLLELAAVAHLRQWESTGVIKLLDADLPTSDQALKEIATKLDHGFASFGSIETAELWHRVNATWCQRLAWDGNSILGADIVLCSLNDDDVFIEALAKLLLAHRRRLRESGSV